MGSRDELLARVMKEAKEDGWFQPGISVVAAVSGGPDSMALLHMLKSISEETPIALAAAHANHGFRGAESEAEAQLVGRTAASWNIPFVRADLDIPSYMEETGKNAQAAAREKRYRFLLETAAGRGASFVALGHHADDQAETVLMRVLRGTGTGGLAGIPYRRTEGKVELIRPLLRITKRELLSYCERNGVPYAADSSNTDRHYFRNAVRLDIIPLLETYNPRLKESLIRLADVAAADDDYLEAEAAVLFPRFAVRSGDGFRLERRMFLGLHVALQRRLIKLILSCSADPCHSLEFRVIEEILGAFGDNGPTVTRFDIGNGWMLNREYDDIYVGPALPGKILYRHTVEELPCSFTFAETGTSVTIERWPKAATLPPDSRWEAFFDESELTFPLVVRSRKPGDRMEPAGLNGTKKVQDIFVDAKVPRSIRDSWPLIADDGGRILWIPGIRRSRLATGSSGSDRLIRVAVTPGEPLIRAAGT